MSRTLTCSFNVFLSDGFEKAVREYFGDIEGDLTHSDIVEYLEQNMNPARSTTDSFEVEGGDTDGWFLQGYEEE